jgi:hypothetical protein
MGPYLPYYDSSTQEVRKTVTSQIGVSTYAKATRLGIESWAKYIQSDSLLLLINNLLVEKGVLLAAVYKSPGKDWRDADITELLSFRRKTILAGDLNAKHPFWNSRVLTPQARKS